MGVGMDFYLSTDSFLIYSNVFCGNHHMTNYRRSRNSQECKDPHRQCVSDSRYHISCNCCCFEISNYH